MRYSVLILLVSAFVALSQQVNPNDALLLAASADDVLGIDQALANGADINTTTVDGQTPLILAAFLGHLKAVRFLVTRKADLNHRGAGGETALMYAAGTSPEIASELIKAGADVNVQDNDNRTALMHTTNSDVKKQLKNAGAKEKKWVNPRASNSIPLRFPAATPNSPDN